MSAHEQTRNDFSEALMELLSKMLEQMKKRENKNGLSKEILEEDLSSKAKELLEIFKNNPELAKEVITKFAEENMDFQKQRFDEFNKKGLQEVSGLKMNIDFSSENANEVIEVLNKYESLLINQRINSSEIEMKINESGKEKEIEVEMKINESGKEKEKEIEVISSNNIKDEQQDEKDLKTNIKNSDTNKVDVDKNRIELDESILNDFDSKQGKPEAKKEKSRENEMELE
jgi:hypothetical protein